MRRKAACIVELVAQCPLVPCVELLHLGVRVELDELSLANFAPLLDDHVVLGHVLHDHDVCELKALSFTIR